MKLKYCLVVLVTSMLPASLLGEEKESYYLSDNVAAQVREVITESYYYGFSESETWFASQQLKPVEELDSSDFVARVEFYHNYIHLQKMLDCPIEGIALYDYRVDVSAEGIDIIVAITNDSIWILATTQTNIGSSSDNIAIYVDLVSSLFQYGNVDSLDEQSASQLALLPFTIDMISGYHFVNLLYEWEDIFHPNELSTIPDSLFLANGKMHKIIRPPETVKSHDGYMATAFWWTSNSNVHKTAILVTVDGLQVVSNQVIGQVFRPSSIKGK